MSFTRNLQNYLTKNNHKKPNNAEWSGSIDDYTLLDQIGSGSFGRVFKARFNNDKECAVKFISKLKSPNIGKILSEVSIHIRLVHRNILQLYTVTEDPKYVYLVMELCRGGSLSQVINEQINNRSSESKLKPALPYELISILLRQVCDALTYLHRHSIVHRDLNLNNILLVNPINFNDFEFNSFHVKLADFGLAIDLNTPQTEPDIPMGNTICGTPGFISPEIWTQVRSVSYKSDIFSLGSILYSCITGKAPKGDTDLKCFLPMTADLITRLLHQNPDDRPELNDIMEHIFVSGRINSSRIYPMKKVTNTFEMSVDQLGNAQLCFVKNKLTFNVSRDGSRVSIIRADQSPISYGFYELPECYWKKYSYLVRFVNLVKAKTAKITVHCSDWFRQENNDLSNEYISKCVLMENGNFEATLHNEMIKENYKFIFNDQHSLKPNIERYKSKLEHLFAKVCVVEKELTNISCELKMNMFPITLGMNRKIFEQSGVNLDGITTSQILRSIQIDGIGHATQFTNGSIQVNFTDGSGLCLDNDSQIFYLENGAFKKFTKDDILPEKVLHKISRLPQVINHLRANRTLYDDSCSSINSENLKLDSSRF